MKINGKNCQNGDHCHIWPRPGVKEKFFGLFCVRMQTYIRRQSYGQRPDGVYALSVLIRSAASLLPWQLPGSPKAGPTFCPSSFLLAPSGRMIHTSVWQAACERLTQNEVGAASGMTSAVLCRNLVFRTLSQHAPGYSGCFIGKGYAGPVFTPSRCKLRQPSILSGWRRPPGHEWVKHSPCSMDE